MLSECRLTSAVESDRIPRRFICGSMPQASCRSILPLTANVRTSKQKVPNRKDEVDSECCGGSGLSVSARFNVRGSVHSGCCGKCGITSKEAHGSGCGEWF